MRAGSHSKRRLRIGMRRPVENVAHAAALDDLARIHHRDAVAQLGDQPEMMGDEQNRASSVLLKLLQQSDDLDLERGIERGRRLIGNQQLGLRQHGHGDGDALPHAAGKFMRILRQSAAMDRECRPAPASPCYASACLRWKGRSRYWMSAHLPADAQDGVERRHRILEDDGHPIAANTSSARSDRLRRSVPESAIRPPVMRPLAGRSPKIAFSRVDLPHPDSPTMPTISPLPHLEAHIAQGVQRRLGRCELDCQVADAEDGHPSAVLPQLRVIGVAQRLAEEGEADGGDDDRQSAGDGEPRRLADKGIAVIEDGAPRGRGRADAEAKEAHPGLGSDDHGQVHADENENGSDDIGKNMHAKHPPDRGADGDRGEHELGIPQSKRLCTDDARIGGRREQDHHQNDSLEAGTDDRWQGQGPASPWETI